MAYDILAPPGEDIAMRRVCLALATLATVTTPSLADCKPDQSKKAIIEALNTSEEFTNPRYLSIEVDQYGERVLQEEEGERYLIPPFTPGASKVELDVMQAFEKIGLVKLWRGKGTSGMEEVHSNSTNAGRELSASYGLPLDEGILRFKVSDSARVKNIIQASDIELSGRPYKVVTALLEERSTREYTEFVKHVFDLVSARKGDVSCLPNEGAYDGTYLAQFLMVPDKKTCSWSAEVKDYGYGTDTELCSSEVMQRIANIPKFDVVESDDDNARDRERQKNIDAGIEEYRSSAEVKEDLGEIASPSKEDIADEKTEITFDKDFDYDCDLARTEGDRPLNFKFKHNYDQDNEFLDPEKVQRFLNETRDFFLDFCNNHPPHISSGTGKPFVPTEPTWLKIKTDSNMFAAVYDFSTKTWDIRNTIADSINEKKQKDVAAEEARVDATVAEEERVKRVHEFEAEHSIAKWLHLRSLSKNPFAYMGKTVGVM